VSAFGYRVQLLQSALNKLGASLTVDGKLGTKTYEAINDNGGLPFYTWNSTCEIGNVCSLQKEDYELILANATKEGWVIKNAEDLASETWLPFVQRGDDWSYNNLKM
jgi:lysozyme family protein